VCAYAYAYAQFFCAFWLLRVWGLQKGTDTELSNKVTTTKNSKIYHKKQAQSNKIMRASQQQLIFYFFSLQKQKQKRE
jgi:hypothetical protein